MTDEIADMPGMEAAMARLDAMEGTPSVMLDAVTTPPPVQRDSADASRAAVPAKEPGQNSDSPAKPDTRATADKPVATEPNKSPEVKPDPAKLADAAKPDASADANKSRYAKSQERLTRTWEQVNADRAAVTAEKTRLETERTDFARKQAEFQAIQRAAEQPQFKVEDYTNAAQQNRQLADHRRAEAKRLEDGGKYAEAEKLNKLAAKNDAIAEELIEHAEKLAKNPPAGFAQRAQQFETARKAWTVHAAKEHPDLAKDGSEFQQGVAAHLNALTKQDPQLAVHPSMIYHVSRMVAVQLAAKAAQADAARVPGLVKEAESLRAKVKELEALTAPASAGGVSRLGADAPDDMATLREEARNRQLF